MADENTKQVRVNVTSDDNVNDDAVKTQTNDDVIDDTKSDGVKDDISTDQPGQIAKDLYEDLLKKDIIDLMGLSDIDDQKKQDLKKTMMDTIQMRLIARVDDQISDDDLPEWKKLLEDGDPEEINPYLEKKGVNVNQIMAEETLIYKLEMVKASQQLNIKTQQGN